MLIFHVKKDNSDKIKWKSWLLSYSCIVPILHFFVGSLAHSVTDHSVSLCGASGGCYALIGAHIASVITVSFPKSWAPHFAPIKFNILYIDNRYISYTVQLHLIWSCIEKKNKCLTSIKYTVISFSCRTKIL